MLFAPNQKSMSYMGQMVMKIGLISQSVCITKNGSQPMWSKVVAFIWKVECKKYPKAVRNSKTREQEMQVRKLHEQQGIKPTMKQTSVDTRIAALEAKVGITSQPKKGDVKKKEGETLEEPKWERNSRNPVVTHQASGAKHKEPG